MLNHVLPSSSPGRSEVLALGPREKASRLARARSRNGSILQKVVYLAGDLLALGMAHVMAVPLVQHFLRAPAEALNPAQYQHYYIPVFAAVLYLFDGYASPNHRRPERELERGCQAVCVAFLGLVLFNFVFLKTQVFSRYLLFSWFGLAGVLLILVRFLLRAMYVQFWKAGWGRRRTVLIGSPAGLSGFRQALSVQRHHGYELLGLISECPPEGSASPAAFPVPLLGPVERWQEIVTGLGADLLVVEFSGWPHGEDSLGRILRDSRGLGLDVEVYSDVLAASHLNFERDDFSGCLRFHARPPWSLALQRVFKRWLDLVIGIVGSGATLFLTPWIAALIKLQDGGPIFYASAYLGRDGRIRHYLKFRTMRVDADQVLGNDPELQARFQAKHKLVDDPRVTRLGEFLRKSSLDEFPQFFSVLKGDLSFVGPRTIRREEAAQYGRLLPKLLSVRPGVTGFWQAVGRQTTTYEERVQMDMFYIDRWSIWLDLVIIGRTVWRVVTAEGAY